MNKRFRLTLLLLLGIGLTACNTKTQSPSVTQAESSIFADSLYRLKNYTGLVCDTLSNLKFENGMEPDSNAKKKILDSFSVFSSSYFYLTHMVYVAKQHTVGDIQPVIVRISADDYSALVLVNFNSRGDVVDRMELSGGPCAGPEDENDSFLVVCPTTYAKVVDSSHLKFFKLDIKYPALHSAALDSTRLADPAVFAGYDSIPVIDSISYNLEIKPSGKIVSTFIDSVRVEFPKSKS